ncbi:inositol monophosphatase [Paenibacillus sp. MER TA 81-3]|uniref:inositol monophosphatase family protein n=1 Tax=Paenibacillus sp. MER TA 81-3 TaxID=2939573 RepID=UPI00203A778F|nr:inositol monophosphatase family protein [Paenibacillus sp. MER TA 81-3]MCM3341848.1 inositol monophosphatase [Paenibacillus sp. MER TA 81-3]
MSTSDKTPYVVTSKSYTAVAVNCAAKTGEWIKSRLGQHKSLHIKSSLHDLVTEVDKGAEQMIRKLILTHFPQHAILGEESVEPGSEASKRALEQAQEEEYLWVVDPLDGTTNFVHGFPFYSVSIALAHRGEVIVGIVYDPMRDELFVAEKGKGAYVHGNRMQAAPESKLSESLLASGFPTERDRALPGNLAGINALAPQVRNIRTAGSAALHMAYVAAGRLTGFWELNLNAWDLAAGSLLISESGGQITDTFGKPYHLGVRDVVASNGLIHDAFIGALKDGNAQG